MIVSSAPQRIFISFLFRSFFRSLSLALSLSAFLHPYFPFSVPINFCVLSSAPVLFVLNLFIEVFMAFFLHAKVGRQSGRQTERGMDKQSYQITVYFYGNPMQAHCFRSRCKKTHNLNTLRHSKRSLALTHTLTTNAHQSVRRSHVCPENHSI